MGRSNMSLCGHPMPPLSNNAAAGNGDVASRTSPSTRHKHTGILLYSMDRSLYNKMPMPLFISDPSLLAPPAVRHPHIGLCCTDPTMWSASHYVTHVVPRPRSGPFPDMSNSLDCNRIPAFSQKSGPHA
jgi:hypothetical protein